MTIYDIYIYMNMIKYDNIGLNPVCTAAGVYILYNIYIYIYACTVEVSKFVGVPHIIQVMDDHDL